MSDLKYTEDHEWVRVEGDIIVIGISDFAQEQLGDVVFVELPEVGATFNKMDVFGTIEAVKAVSELFSPLGGEIVEVNSALDGDPSLVNQEPYGDGWMIKVQVRDPAELERLLSPSDYAQHIGE